MPPIDYSVTKKIIENGMVNVDKLCPHSGFDNDIYNIPACKAKIVNKEPLYTYVPDAGRFLGPKTTKAKAMVYGGEATPLYVYTCENGHKWVRWEGWCDVPVVEPGTNNLRLPAEKFTNEGKMFGWIEEHGEPRAPPGYVAIVEKIEKEGYKPTQDELDQYGITPEGKGHGNPAEYELRRWGLK
ncbi:MAG TPA: hypothetical protein ENI32_06450 [Candidatus Syntrophoarchaeum butanivorans]|uniref:Uncharacterized protein n=1 Tax=Candidatus Syntropharchaeum butanivorans TaxID=1839936 RepID=A0A1F2P7Q7_9EURY|nr:MAG: hypothetical protein SBU_000315 [Candidatus Syntrophoarchaeum butanivorans]HEC57504.1 hypothetical protein [Candidatus Syntrophoarchaeum butanivorans]